MANNQVKDDKRSIFFKVAYNDTQSTAWHKMDTMRVGEPYLTTAYAMDNELVDKPGFEWVKTYLEADEEHLEVMKAFKAKQGTSKGKVFKFGVEVPRNPAHALQLDKEQ